MIKLLILAMTQLSLLQASSCRSMKKISGSENWISCWAHPNMDNCGDGCCCVNGYEYKNGWCLWSGGKCCLNQEKINFDGDVRHGGTIRALDGCMEFECYHGVLLDKRAVHLDSNKKDVCDGVSISSADTREPECETGYTKVLGYPWVNDHKYPSGRADMTRKECADACSADGNCIAYTATGMCMATQVRETFADALTRALFVQKTTEAGIPGAWAGINYCVKDRTTIPTGANSCDWSHQIPRLTNYVSLDVCARQCADDAECRAFYLYKKNPFSKKPLCVGFSQECAGVKLGAPRHAPYRADLAEPCRDNEWCGYVVIKSFETAQILIKN